MINQQKLRLDEIKDKQEQQLTAMTAHQKQQHQIIDSCLWSVIQWNPAAAGQDWWFKKAYKNSKSFQNSIQIDGHHQDHYRRWTEIKNYE